MTTRLLSALSCIALVAWLCVPNVHAAVTTFTGQSTYAQQTDGTWNRIEVYAVDDQWSWDAGYDAALAYAQTVGLSEGNPSYLATPRSALENATLQAVLNNDIVNPINPVKTAWIGLSDVAVEGEWRLIDNGELIWTGGVGGSPEPGAYTNWTSAWGEPNDGVGGTGVTEDGAHIIGGTAWGEGGRWMDHTLGAPDGAGRNRFLVEIETALPERPAVPILDDPIPATYTTDGYRVDANGRGLWGVRRVDLPNSGSQAFWAFNLEAYEARLYSLSNPNYNPTVTAVTAEVPVINFEDPGFATANQISPNPVPFPGDQAGNDDRFVVKAFATIRIAAGEEGDYTFAFRGDEAGRLTIKGAAFTNVGIVAGSSTNITTEMYKNQPAGTRDTLSNMVWWNNSMASAVANLQAGDYEIEYYYIEGGSVADTELLAAKGVVSSMVGGAASQFRLVGYKASDGAYADVTVYRPGLDPGTNGGYWAVEFTAPSPNGSGSDILTVADAEAALTAGSGTTNTLDVQPSLNYGDPGPGSIGADIPFPNGGGDNFAGFATAKVLIPQDGTYRFGFQGDDGGYLRIVGADFGTTLIENAMPAAAIDEGGERIICDCLGGNTRTIGETYLLAGTYDIEVLYLERDLGAYWEVFASGEGNLDAYQLLSRNGAGESYADFDGIQLVPEPSSIALALLGLIGMAFTVRRRRSA